MAAIELEPQEVLAEASGRGPLVVVALVMLSAILTLSLAVAGVLLLIIH